MITLQQAFNIARQNSLGVKLDKIAYDLGDSWAFDYGGTEPICGFLPVIVKKEDGTVVPFDMMTDEARLDSAKRVEV